jgi:acetyl-CoA carboxylase biotin carboxyl carrier protein
MAEANEDAGIADDAAGSVGQAQDTLQGLRREVIALLAELPRLPTALRVQASGVAVEVSWGGTHAEPVPAHAVAAPAMAPTAVQPPPATGAASADDEGVHYVCAPTVGVFYRSPQPGAKAFVAEGDSVSVGEQVAIVEAMKLFLPVEADQEGRVARFLVTDGSSVEFGERLIALEKVG